MRENFTIYFYKKASEIQKISLKNFLKNCKILAQNLQKSKIGSQRILVNLIYT